MNQPYRTTSIPASRDVAIDDDARRVLRNTWNLLGMTVLFAAVCAYVAMVVNLQYPGFVVFLVGAIGLSMLTSKLSNSAWGLLSMFAFSGFMGAMVGTILDFYLARYGNGHELVIAAAASTGVAFLGMSGFALITKKDFTFMGPFLSAGLLVAFVAMIAAWYFELSALYLAVCAMFALLSTAMILWQTQQIVRGGERNYIRATLMLFMSVYNIFVTLLQLFGFAFGEE